MTGTHAASTVAALQGKAVSATAPTDQQVLKYDAASSSWEPAADDQLGRQRHPREHGRGPLRRSDHDERHHRHRPRRRHQRDARHPVADRHHVGQRPHGGGLTRGGNLDLALASRPRAARRHRRPDRALGTVGIANGGTGITTAPTAADEFLRANAAGTGWTVGAITAADLPNLSGTYVDLVSDQTIAGTKTFANIINGNIAGNAHTVSNGVYTTNSYANPSGSPRSTAAKISAPSPTPSAPPPRCRSPAASLATSPAARTRPRWRGCAARRCGTRRRAISRC